MEADVSVRNYWHLTDREIQVIEAMMDVESNKGIANMLRIELKTVEQHMQNIRRKMGVHSKVGVAIKWDRTQRPIRETV